MKKIRIYQLNENAENARYMMFCGLDSLKRLGLRDKLSIDLYDMVWEGEIEDDANLDDIYTKFNINRPADFKGHSLSTSDIVEVDGKFFYCDSYGWEEVFSQPKNTKEHEITLFYHNIHFAKNGNLLSGNIKIGTWEKEVLGGRDASGNKLVPYLYWITLNGMTKRKQIPYYSREEVKKSLDCKTIKVQLPF